MEKPLATALLERVAQSESIARKLNQIAEQHAPVKFSHVIDPAQAFLAGAIARNAQKTVWILCPNVRAQDAVYETLLNWISTAQFLPEAEFAAVENVLPDPEIAAERLALLAKIDSEPGPHVIVTTRASLDQPAPKRGAVRSATLQIKRGANSTMEQLLEKVSAAGYERVAQVTTRGQFAVRGGIVDLYSWQAPLPARVEFFGDNVESLREFDIDTQTSVRDLRQIDILLGASRRQKRQGSRLHRHRRSHSRSRIRGGFERTSSNQRELDRRRSGGFRRRVSGLQHRRIRRWRFSTCGSEARPIHQTLESSGAAIKLASSFIFKPKAKSSVFAN